MNREYSKETAHRLAGLSRLSYADGAEIRAKAGLLLNAPLIDWGFFDHRDTQAFIVVSEKFAVVVFRGTECRKDVVANIACDLVEVAHGRVHRGFSKALDEVWGEVVAFIKGRLDGQSIIFADHSLGAALATLAAYRLETTQALGRSALPFEALYTFGSPRVGDKAFADYCNTAFGQQSYRHVNNNDIVCRVPLRAMQYRHIGQLKYFDAQGRLYEKLSSWQRLQFWAAGLRADLFKPGLDGIKDHGIENYERCLSQFTGPNSWYASTERNLVALGRALDMDFDPIRGTFKKKLKG